MKRWIVFLAVTVLLGLYIRVEPTGTDVASLEPVKLLYVDSRDGAYFLTTDTGQQGRGNTVSQAISDLKETSTGKVYLDTAQHLLISRSAWEAVDRLSEHLRPDCSLTVAEGIPNAEKAAAFLDTHKPGFTLNDFRAGEKKVPVLYFGDGGMHLEKS